MNRSVPFSKSRLEEIIATYPTPFHIYDEKAIVENAKKLYGHFSWIKSSQFGGKAYMNYFAVKALPNPHIMRILKDQGLGFDCSSIAELVLCEKIGVKGEDIMFTSNDTKAEEYQKALDLGAVINLDDISHLEFLKEKAHVPDLLCFRYNPGKLREGNALIGKPEEAKYGLTREQLFDAYAKARTLGVKRFGLHTMVASNELNPQYFVDTAEMLIDLVIELWNELKIRIEFINLGGGIGIAYRADQKAVDLAYVSSGVQALYEKKIIPAGLDPLRIVTENGRVITGPYGYLVSTAIHHKHIYKEYVGLDSCMANLMRPGMYGSYHHITVMGKEDAPRDHTYDVTGSLCENNDKFAIDRQLPGIERGDLLVIHDTGAHGHAMGFNYNGKLRSAELLLRSDGSVVQIRRAETLDDLFSTLDFSKKV